MNVNTNIAILVTGFFTILGLLISKAMDADYTSEIDVQGNKINFIKR